MTHIDILRSGSSSGHSGLGSGSALVGSGAREAESGRRSSVLPGLAGSVPHHLGVDGAAHTVGQLGVELGQLVLGVHAGVGDVPHGGGLDDVADHELLDGLVLGTRLENNVRD